MATLVVRAPVNIPCLKRSTLEIQFELALSCNVSELYNYGMLCESLSLIHRRPLPVAVSLLFVFCLLGKQTKETSQRAVQHDPILYGMRTGAHYIPTHIVHRIWIVQRRMRKREKLENGH